MPLLTSTTANHGRYQRRRLLRLLFQQWLVLHEDYIHLLQARFGRDGTAAADDDGLVSLVLDHYWRY